MKFISLFPLLFVVFSASAQLPRPIEGGWFLPNGWSITPAGEHLPAKDAVLNLALSPDGKHMAALSCGYNEHEVLLIDTETGKSVQRVMLPTAWLGLAWAPNGETLYVSGGNRKQEKAEAAPVFAIPFKNGKLSKRKILELRDTMPRAETFWSGLVHHPSKPLLYAASRMTGEVVIFDTQIGAVSGRVKVERDPYDLVISADGANLYCSNWGSDSLSVIDLNTNTLLRTVAAGDNPNDMTLLPDGRLFVCSSNDNSVLCFDTAQMRFTEKVVTSLHHEAGRATAHVVARGKDERIDCLAFATRKSSRSHGSHEKPRGNSLKSSH